MPDPILHRLRLLTIPKLRRTIMSGGQCVVCCYGSCRRRCVPAKRVDALKEVLRDVSSPVSLLVKGKVSFSAETIVLDAVSMLK